MKDFLPILQNSQLFFGITLDEIESMLGCLDARAEQFSKGEYIFRSGDTSEVLGLVIHGNALIIQEDFWGNRNILSPIEQGECFGETFACAPGSVLNVSVIAQSQTTILFLNVKRILSVCPSTCSHHTQIIRNLLSSLAYKNLNFNEKITHLTQRTTRTKLLSYLSAEAKRHHKAAFDIPFSRQQLADYLSVDRSGLSVELCKMRDEGLLDFNRNHFVLKS